MTSKGRSERSRNLLGAFLGGLVGILAFGYLTPWLLPVGVLVGVVTGYWYGEIWRGCRASCVRAKSAFDSVPTWAATRWNSRWGDTVLGVDADWVKRRRTEMAAAVVFWTGYLLAGVVNAVGALAAIYWAYSGLSRTELRHGQGADVAVSLVAAAVILAVVGFLTWVGVALARSKFGDESCSVPHRDWSRAPIRFVGKRFFMTLYCEAVSVLLLLILGLYWVGFGALTVAVVFLPVIAFIIATQVVTFAIRHGGHGTCLAVTLVVTSASAFMFRNLFGNQMLLWSVALGTGMVSATCVELAVFHIKHAAWWAKYSQNLQPLDRRLDATLSLIKLRFSKLGERLLESVCAKLPFLEPLAE